MENKKPKKLIPVITALVLVLALTIGTGCGGCFGLLGCVGCVGSCISALGGIDGDDIFDPDEWDFTLPTPDYPTQPETTKPSRPDNPVPRPSSGVTIGDGSFVYEEYDPADFYDKCDELRELATGNDSNAVNALYDELYEEYKYIDEDSSILYVAYSQDPADEYLSEQYLAFDEMIQEIYDYFMTSIYEVCQGPCANDFKKHVGEEYFEVYEDYVPMTDEQADLYKRESELVDQYYTAIEEAEDEGTPDSELVDIVGPIYLELVQVRTQLANTYGYDNYADYADENIYCRDFNGEDAAAFCETVKKFSADYYDLLYNSSAYFSPYYINEKANPREMLADLKTYAGKISTYAAEAADLLIDDQLYSIGDDDERMTGAYTISFAKSDVPFLFETTDGNATDFCSLNHEFGHFTAFHNNMNPNILVYSYGSLEISEIHSNGLQSLYSYYFDDIYGNLADTMEAYTVINLLSNIVDGCVFDEFQREIYANPDMTLDQVNKLYGDLCKEYGDTYSTLYGGADYWWIHVSHSFESPMYYFSYAASGIVALEIWLETETDMDRAIEIWEALIEAGSYKYGYMELLEMIGVSDFTDSSAVLMTCQVALDYVRNHSTSY